MIEVSHISKSFHGKKALDDVSLTVGQHEAVCIIGSMGSGKSTLMRCIAGLESPDKEQLRSVENGWTGRVRVDTTTSEWSSRTSISFHISMCCTI